MPRRFPLGPNRPPQSLVELADRLRELTETMLRIDQLPEEMARRVADASAELEALTGELGAFAKHDVTPRMGAEPNAQRPYYVSGVLMGDHHPLRPELEIGFDDGVTRGTVNFGVTFEGPPGCVHGGFVAHFFDQILGEHNLAAHIPAMTGTLTVRYRTGTPILRELSFEVRHTREGERKVVTRGQLVADGVVFSEAWGTFIIPRGAAWEER
jgi:hypothetical protein